MLQCRPLSRKVSNMFTNIGRLGSGLLLICLLPTAIAQDSKDDKGPWFLDDLQQWPADLRQRWANLDDDQRSYVSLRLSNVPVLDLFESKGSLVRLNQVKVFQIVDHSNMLILIQVTENKSFVIPGGRGGTYQPRNLKYWVEGVSTDNITDGSTVDLGAYVFAASGTKEYTTTDRSFKLSRMKAIDQTAADAVAKQILARRGFRVWVFRLKPKTPLISAIAKLRKRTGRRIYLEAPDGTRKTVVLSNFSEADQAWLENQTHK